MGGFLTALAGANNQYKDKQRLQRFQDLELGQKQAAQDLQNRIGESQIAENNARAESLRNPKATQQPLKWELAAREDGTYLVNPTTGEAKKINVPGVPKTLAVQQPDRTIVPVQDPNGGGAVYMPREAAIGKHAPSPNATGKAALMKDVAANQTQVSVIDDALNELNAHPDAVGLKRGAADLPLIGGAADAINQRVDEGGIAARASLANVSSLVIKDRSGSAVTVSESARLRPFIPNTGDTPAAIRVKLSKLKAAIQTETRLLQQGMGQNSGTQSPASSGNIDLSKESDKKAAPKKRSAAEILAAHGIK